MRPLLMILVTAVLALFGACPALPHAIGNVLGLVFGGVLQVFHQPALLFGAVLIAGAVVARRSSRRAV